MITIAVTGSSGYLGGAVATHAERRGHEVVALTRRADVLRRTRHFDLSGTPSTSLLRDVDVVVHCAWDLTLSRPNDVFRINVDGSRRLAMAAAAAGTKFVFISSMSAYAHTEQLYGRAKLAAEKAVLELGGLIVRPGLVYGDGGQGMIGALRRLTALPVTPIIGRYSHQFLIHVDDMASGVLAVCTTSADPQGPVGLAHPRPVRFEDILAGLATRSGRELRVVPIPWRATYWAMRAAEAARIPLPLRADSVLGLVRAAPLVPQPEFWSQFNLTIRTFAEWLAQTDSASAEDRLSRPPSHD